MRFECVGRLGGVKSIAREDKSIVELVMDTEKTRYAIILETPGLTGEHPAYQENLQTGGLDHASQTRKYIPDAIRQFKRKIRQEAREKV